MLGTGTQQDPFIIETPTDFDQIHITANLSKHFILGNDIDFTGHTFPRYDSTANFTGSFNGKGFTVKNAHIEHPNTTALIPTLRESSCVNVKFDNITIIHTANTSSGFSGILGNVNLGSVVDNVEVSNSILDSGTAQFYTGMFRSVVNGSKVTNIKINNVTIIGGRSGVGFLGRFSNSPSFPDNIVNNIVAYGKLSPPITTAVTDGLFANPADGTIKIDNSYVLDSNLPKFDHSKASANIVTDAELRDTTKITLSDKWSHSTGDYPELISFSANAGKEVTVKKTITVQTILIKTKRSQNLYYQRSVGSGKGSIGILAKHYSTRSGLFANKIEFTSSAKRINVQRIKSTVNVNPISMSWVHYKNVLRLFPIDFRRAEVFSNVIYPIGDNVPVYAYVGLRQHMSTTQLRNNQSSVFRIL